MICNPLKDQVFDIKGLCFEQLKGFEFGDCFDEGDEIGVLIGIDFYWEVFNGKVVRGENGLFGLETKVRWVLSGMEDKLKNEIHTNFNSYTHVIKTANEHSFKNLFENVKKLWDIKSIGIRENEKSLYQESPDEICINKGECYKANLPF